MSQRVHIVDYGVGNIRSVCRAVEQVGGIPEVTSCASDISRADRLILPGVGAFRNGMSEITARGLDQALLDFAATGRPILGICLGMQLLASESLEFGKHQGLGLIPGHVVPIPPLGLDDKAHKVPFIGWATLVPANIENFESSILSSIKADESVYLVHSFYVDTESTSDVLANYRYNGQRITAAIRRGNVMGCQFHPEKSGAVGLRILRRFLDI